MTVTVEVNATWRMSRVEFSLYYGFPAAINGYGEVLLQEATPSSPEAAILRRRNLPGVQGDPTTYGVMPGDMITRVIDATLLAETVEVDGTTIDLKTVMLAMEKFLDRWRIEDANKPPTPLPPPVS